MASCGTITVRAPSDGDGGGDGGDGDQQRQRNLLIGGAAVGLLGLGAAAVATQGRR